MPQSRLSKMINNIILPGVFTCLLLLGLVVVLFSQLPSASITPKAQKPQRPIEKVDVFGQPCNESSCLIGYGERCAVGDRCIGNLKCIGTSQNEMRCKCSKSSILHTGGTKDIAYCFGDVGAPCDPEDRHPCIERTECVSINKQTHRCECKIGFVENLANNMAIRGCEIAYGQSCGVEDKVPCDTSSSLTCYEGVCHCPSFGHFYEEDRRRCAIPVGITCTYDYECVINAICKNPHSYQQDPSIKNWGFITPTNKGRCACINNATIDSTNTFCVISV